MAVCAKHYAGYSCTSAKEPSFSVLLSIRADHYLRYHSVGQNMKYLVFDKDGAPLSCLLFGSAAWKCAPRDEYIGWSRDVREARVNWLTNNTRFLVLPWVKVPHLVSHILGQVARRIKRDWVEKYRHPVYLLETVRQKVLQTQKQWDIIICVPT